MMTPNEPTDEELLREYRTRGNENAFAELYKRKEMMIIGVCCHYLKNIEDAKDECQNLYIKLTVQQSLKNEEIRNFDPWLHRTTINHCLDVLRKVKPFIVEIEENKIDEFLEREDFVRLAVLLNKETGDKNLNDCIDNLSEGQKECIIRFYFKNQCYKRIAEDTDYTMRDVTTLLQNGRRNLKICMERKTQGA